MRTTTYLAILIVGAMLYSPSAEAYVPTHFSGCGVARIDGVFDPLEWSGAAQKSFSVNLPGGGTAPATLYVMNDNLNIYVAVRFQRSAPDPVNAIWVIFDRPPMGVVDGDDGVNYSTAKYAPGFHDTYLYYSSFLPDANNGGTSDGEGAFSNDGQWSVIEISHEWKSGDAHDIDLLSGGSVPFTIQVGLASGPGWQTTTWVPGLWVYDIIDIANCEPVTLGGCGKATVDGVIGAIEWIYAARHPLSLRTPGGGTTPATLLVMNDGANLYLGLQFDRAAPDPGNSFSAELDSDGSDSMTSWDDTIVHTDGYGFTDDWRTTQAPCPSGAMCGFRDEDYNGHNDGSGAFVNNGVTSSYEVAHPLSSGEVFDISVWPGSSLPFFINVRMIGAGSVWPDDFGDTRYPEYGYTQLGVKFCRVRN